MNMQHDASRFSNALDKYVLLDKYDFETSLFSVKNEPNISMCLVKFETFQADDSDWISGPSLQNNLYKHK